MQEAHRIQLKPHVEDEHNESPTDLFYFSRKAVPVEVGPDEWLVDKIENHRVSKATGEVEFLVKWKNWDGEAQWQPWQNFFQLCNEEVLAYCHTKQVPLSKVLKLPLSQGKEKRH